jgi:hypothetical protein
MSSNFIFLLPKPNITHYVKKSHLKISYNNLIQPYYNGFTSIILGFDIKNKEEPFNLEYYNTLVLQFANISNNKEAYFYPEINLNYKDFKILSSTLSSDKFCIKLKRECFYFITNIIQGNVYNTYDYVSTGDPAFTFTIPFIFNRENNIIPQQNVTGANAEGVIIEDTIHGDIATISGETIYNIISKLGYNYNGNLSIANESTIDSIINSFYVSRK